MGRGALTERERDATGKSDAVAKNGEGKFHLVFFFLIATLSTSS